MKTYKCVCNVCGKVHTVKALFLSTDYRVVDGENLLVVNCEGEGKHSPAEVRAAYDKRYSGDYRMTEEQYQQFKLEYAADPSKFAC